MQCSKQKHSLKVTRCHALSRSLWGTQETYCKNEFSAAEILIHVQGSSKAVAGFFHGSLLTLTELQRLHDPDSFERTTSLCFKTMTPSDLFGTPLASAMSHVPGRSCNSGSLFLGFCFSRMYLFTSILAAWAAATRRWLKEALKKKGSAQLTSPNTPHRPAACQHSPHQ